MIRKKRLLVVFLCTFSTLGSVWGVKQKAHTPHPSIPEATTPKTSVQHLSSPTSFAPEVHAPYAYLVDFSTGTVLFERNATAPMVPSSMTKLMTLYELFSVLKKERLHLTDTLSVSEQAWRARGSRSFLNAGDQITVENLIRCIIVHSGNDACVVVAEALGGSETLFAEMMTQTAQHLGARATQFRNATGWPDEDHYASAEDLALFARRLITDFPEHYHYFSEKEFLISGILQRNRNALLWRNLGVDGLKTGRTDAGGYGIVVSAQQKGHRLIAVVNGCVSNKERVRDIEALLRWGFNGFSFYKIVRSREPLSSAEVWLGEKATVDLETDQDICFIVPRLQAQNVEIEVVYQGPLKAPIEKGARVASLWISVPGKEPVEYPLFACTSIKQVGPLKRIPTAITSLLFGVQSP